MNDSTDMASDDQRDPARALRDWHPAPRISATEPVADWSRRRVAMIIVLVALIYPFYATGIERMLLRIELERIATEAREQMAQQQQALAEEARVLAARAAERDLRTRVAAVRVTGAVDGSPPSVVVDRIPPEGAAEAAAFICRQASALLRRPLSGKTLRVMRDLGARPVADAGEVVCP
ncbi:MAG: hypothetical protein IPK27_22985 [Rhodanobacteraceae bacterium]|nr:hypothetical protein [Rhodanobacteraceae bacterium]